MEETPRENEDGGGKTAPVSFTIRLTDKQRDLLTRAAETRGWSVSALLRNAALEKGAFIMNTRSRNKVDFRGLAQAIAEQVFTKRTVRVWGPSHNADRPEQEQATVFPDLLEELADPLPPGTPVASVSPWHRSPNFLDELREAARFGGTEFLEQVIQASEDIVSRSDGKLQSPVDPLTGE